MGTQILALTHMFTYNMHSYSIPTHNVTNTDTYKHIDIHINTQIKIYTQTQTEKKIK